MTSSSEQPKEQKQPKEYTTNSKDIEDIQRFLFDLVASEDLNYRHDLFEKASDAIKRTLARPHLAPTNLLYQNVIANADEIRAEAARKAREDVQAKFVSGKNSNGMGGLYTRPDEPSYIEGIIIGKKYYRLNGSICGTITAKEIPMPDYYKDTPQTEQQEQPRCFGRGLCPPNRKCDVVIECRNAYVEHEHGGNSGS